jgi:hypothetical protein
VDPAERALDQGQRQAFAFQRLGDVFAQAVAQQHHQHLRARVDAQTRLLEAHAVTVLQQILGREFAQHRLFHRQRQTRVAAFDRMADPIHFAGVEEQHLTGFGHGQVVADVAHVDAAIRKHQLGFVRALFFAHVPAQTGTIDVANGNGRRRQQRVDGEFGHARRFGGCDATVAGQRTCRGRGQWGRL